MNEKVSATHSFNNMNLPVSMDPRDYGKVLVLNHLIMENDEMIYRSIVESGNKTFRIDISKDLMVNTVRIQGAVNLEWTDTRLSRDLEDSYTFKREIKKSTIYFLDGEIALRKQLLPAKPFLKASADPKLNCDFHTLDIETIKKEGKIIPYLICAYDGKDYISSYAQQVDGVIDQKTLFNSFFELLLSKVKPGISYVYAHNLSGFDGIFLMKHLLSHGKVKPLLFNGKLISIQVKVLGSKTIVFKDSYLLLPYL